MADQASTPAGISTRESLAALVYFAFYLAFSFWSPGSEMRNYLTLVAGPLFLVVLLRAGDPPSRRPSPVLASFGLRRDNLRSRAVRLGRDHRSSSRPVPRAIRLPEPQLADGRRSSRRAATRYGGGRFGWDHPRRGLRVMEEEPGRLHRAPRDDRRGPHHDDDQVRGIGRRLNGGHDVRYGTQHRLHHLVPSRRRDTGAVRACRANAAGPGRPPTSDGDASPGTGVDRVDDPSTGGSVLAVAG